VFIELTDHLRCPNDHEEAYMVLLPDEVVQRSVKRGELGCPVCRRSIRIEDGVVDSGDAPAADDAPIALGGEAIAALTGLGGPGGFLVLVGPVAKQWRHVSVALPGVSLVAVNGPASVVDEPGVSVLRGARLMLKSASMRGVVLSGRLDGAGGWVREAARVLLPGLRVVGQGAEPDPALLELVASAEDWWVAVRRTR
jgi:uncharacterized protein YbaR (Trm112 family)